MEHKLSLDHAKSYAGDVAALAGGFIAGNVVQKTLIKKDTLLVNGGITAAGIVGAAYFKNPWLKFGCLGLALFGGMRTIQKVVAPAVQTSGVGDEMYGFGSADEMSGLLPEGIKEKIRGFLPTIGAIDNEEIFNVKGTAMEDLHGYEELTGDDDLHGDDDMHGLGQTADML